MPCGHCFLETMSFQDKLAWNAPTPASFFLLTHAMSSFAELLKTKNDDEKKLANAGSTRPSEFID
jgi:hypothetical protein